MRGRFFRRIAIGIGVFFLFVFVAGWLGATFGGGFHEGRRGGPWFLVFPILLLIGFLAFGRLVRRTARPIGEVMDAAARVAEGDYTARATVQGPPDVRDLARAFNRMAERLADQRGATPQPARRRRARAPDAALGDPGSRRGDGRRPVRAGRRRPRVDRRRDDGDGAAARRPPAALERRGRGAAAAPRAARGRRARRDRRGRPPDGREPNAA